MYFVSNISKLLETVYKYDAYFWLVPNTSMFSMTSLLLTYLTEMGGLLWLKYPIQLLLYIKPRLDCKIVDMLFLA